MATIETKDGIFLEIPEGMPPDAPEVKEAVNAERLGRRKRRMDSPEFKAKVAAQQEQDRETYSPTKGMGGLEKTRANIGAGMDAAWQGLKQVLPGVKGASDEEVLEKRQRDAQLAKDTDLGVGADWMPSAGSALQFAGEIAPTLAIPGGALRGAGSAAAARMLPRTMKAVQAATGGPIRAGLTGGAAAGALMPTTSDESRTLNTLIGAGTGAVLPGAVSAFRKARGMWGGERRAGRQMLEAVGEENVPALEQKLAERNAARAAEAPEVRAVPETISEATGSVPLSRVESQLGRSESTLDDMAAFRREQNEARYGAAQRATREADQVAGRDAVRKTTTDPMREQALTAAGQDEFFHVPVAKAAQDALQGASGANPAVKRVAKYVLGEMGENADAAITPARLYEVRKVLASKLEGPVAIADELGAAVKGASRETRKLMDSIDDALDAASGGQWRPYLKTFASQSRGVDEAAAAGEVRGVINKLGRPMVGEAPEMSRGRLTQAIEAARGGQRDFPLNLSPSANKSLDDLLAQIQRAEEPARTRKLTGTQGGGSQTSTDLDGVLRHLATRSNIPGVSMVLEAVGARVTDATKRELVELIQNPQRAMAAIREAQRMAQPLTEAQELLLKATSRSAQALPQALQTQQQAMR